LHNAHVFVHLFLARFPPLCTSLPFSSSSRPNFPSMHKAHAFYIFSSSLPESLSLHKSFIHLFPFFLAESPLPPLQMSFIFSLSSWTNSSSLHMSFIFPFFLATFPFFAHAFYLFHFFLARFPSLHMSLFFPLLTGQISRLLMFFFLFSLLPGQITLLCTCLLSFPFLPDPIPFPPVHMSCIFFFLLVHADSPLYICLLSFPLFSDQIPPISLFFSFFLARFSIFA
jgi:hypothetical protein